MLLDPTLSTAPPTLRARQQINKKRLRALADAAHRRIPYRARPSRYQPHQGARECARRAGGAW
jgi:hypothetical protein